MRFLALTGLQAALLAALTAGVVIGLYMLKLRHRRVFISSSMLWQRVLDEQVARSLWERLRRVVSIVLAVTIALLIALALGRPEIEWLTGAAQRIVIVLDTSPSMNSRTADGSTRFQKAIQRAQAIVDGAGATTEIRIADTSAQTAFPFTTDRAQASQWIRQLAPEGAEPRFPKLDGRESVVYWVSDGVGLQDVPESVQKISVFEQADNVAITAFEIRPVPSNPLAYEAYLEVRNYGQPANVELTLTGTGQDRVMRRVRLDQQVTLKDLFDLSSFAGGRIEARVKTENDALAVDDVAFAYLPIQRRARTLLVTRGNNYLETLLRVNRYVQLETITPANYQERNDVDAYVFDRFAPQTAPSKPALIVGAPAAPWLRNSEGVLQRPTITTWAEEHPIMQYVPVHDVSIERAVRINADNLTVIAASNQNPLIVASEKPRWVMLTFDLSSSDFALQVGFPVFVENVLAWFNREPLALRRAPGLVEVPLANAQIQGADGKVIQSAAQMGQTVFRGNEPGLYTATEGDNRVYLAVNLSNPTLSNINQSTFKEGAPAVPSYTAWLRHELWFYMLMIAIVLISVEWFTYHRRITL
jgi:hypothetical protein